MTEPTPSRNARRNLGIGIGSLAAMALLTGLYWFFFMRGWVTTDDARFAAVMVDVAPRVAGTLDRVLVGEGDAVEDGQPLFHIDDDSLSEAATRARASVASARARLEVAQANLAKAEHGPRAAEIEEARATEARTRAQAELARSDQERADRVFSEGAMSAAEHDRVRTAAETSVHTHEEAAARLALLREGTRDEDRTVAKQNVALAQADVEAAEAAARQAEIDLERATVTAPFPGVVVRQWLDPGSAVAVGRPVLTIMNPATTHVTALVEEKDLRRIAPGDPVTIHVDAYPDDDLAGHVTTIVQAADSQFSLIPAEGVSGAFIKVTQRVPIRIDLDRLPDGPIGPGLSVEIRIDTRDRPPGTAPVASGRP